MKYVAGVDVGSTQTKAVILDENRAIVARALLDMETSMTTVAQEAFKAALEQAGVWEGEIAYVAGTGYGRYKVTFGREQVTEISCHARGAVALFPNTRTVIDIGGQDTKAIRVGPDGRVEDFMMNDKCAAGTGRFLGAASYALEMPLSELGPLALQATQPVRITTTCTVFAESEIISHSPREICPRTC
jgi:predicted CoA-substrate-specific enzyme activase